MGGSKLILLSMVASLSTAQVQQYPYVENFDTALAPALPAGWITTTNRSAPGDFITSTSIAFSPPNSVLSSNATVNQILFSPVFDLSNRDADTLKFSERRSASHNSQLLIEASLDGGLTFPVIIGDTLANPGMTSYILLKFKLPPILSNQSRVKIRWNVLGNGTGSTGTLRFDNIIVSTIAHHDVEVSAVYFFPLYSIEKDSVTIQASIRNAGTDSAENVSVEFYNDYNANNLPESAELFKTELFDSPLLPNETRIVSVIMKDLVFGQENIIIRCASSGDQNIANDIKEVKLTVGLRPQSVVINEIMYAPKNPEPEWVELYNGTAGVVNLKNWKLSNRNSSSKYLITPDSTAISPRSYMIVTKDFDLFNAIHTNVPSTVIQSSSLPTYLFNNNGDAVVLFDSRNALMDSVRYSTAWGGENGFSIERIDYGEASNDSGNWGQSGDSIGSTPGKQNHLTPLDYDLRCVKILTKSLLPELVEISVIVKNVGRLGSDNFTVSIYNDANLDSIPQLSETIETQSISQSLLSKDSMKISFLWNKPGPGKKHLIAVVNYASDMRVSDNFAFNEIDLSFPLNALIINEIMYEPLPHQSEYIELYNQGPESVDVGFWNISDKRDIAAGSVKYVLCNYSFIIRANEFLVYASDSAIYKQFPYLTDTNYKVLISHSKLSLNNIGDDVFLTDLTGNLVDSVHYLPSWHNPDIADVSGRSLERINPKLSSNDRRNWNSCVNSSGGTPGKLNSIFTDCVRSNSEIYISPNPFSPDGDGYEDAAIIGYHISSRANIIRIQIYDVKGRKVRTLADGEPGGASGEFIWDGLNDKQERVRMGIYIVLLEVLDSITGNVTNVKGTVVVAAKL